MTQSDGQAGTQATARPVARVALCLDVTDLDRGTAFWSAALGYSALERAGQYQVLADPSGNWPTLLLQQTPDTKTQKNRMHFDIHAPDIDAEAERLIESGATRLDKSPMSEVGTSWIRMLDPEGNEFCVCQLHDQP